MCTSRKYSYSPHRREWNFLGGGEFCKTQKCKEMCEALSVGGLRKIPSVGEVWIFSGTIQINRMSLVIDKPGHNKSAVR